MSMEEADTDAKAPVANAPPAAAEAGGGGGEAEGGSAADVSVPHVSLPATVMTDPKTLTERMDGTTVQPQFDNTPPALLLAHLSLGPPTGAQGAPTGAPGAVALDPQHHPQPPPPPRRAFKMSDEFLMFKFKARPTTSCVVQLWLFHAGRQHPGCLVVLRTPQIRPHHSFSSNTKH